MQTRHACHTVNDTTRFTRTVGYDATYTWRGRAGHMRTHHNPGVGTGLPIRNGAALDVRAAASTQRPGTYYR